MAKFINDKVEVDITYKKIVLVKEKRLISLEDYEKLMKNDDFTFFNLEEQFLYNEEDYVSETFQIEKIGY